MCKGADRATPEISVGVMAKEISGDELSNRDIKDSNTNA